MVPARQNKSGVSWPMVGLIVAGLAGAGFLIGRYIINKRKEETEAQIATTEVQQAEMFYSAMSAFNLFGQTIIPPFGTDSDKVFEIARQVTKWPEVQTAFKKLYNNSLLDCLQQALSTSDFQELMNIINSNQNQPISYTMTANKNLVWSPWMDFEVTPNRQKYTWTKGNKLPGVTYKQTSVINVNGVNKTLLRFFPYGPATPYFVYLNDVTLTKI